MAVNEFLDLLRRSQLVEEEPLHRFLADLTTKNGGRLPDSGEKIAQAMIAAGMLTEWQSEKLLAGKHKGFMLGKYKLLRHLGKGGMSQVYLAEHMLMKRKVAIKVLPHNKVEDATYLERFRIEARAAARLDDPNIVRVYDIDQDGNTHYIVMEYVEGQDLHQLVRDHGPLAYEKAADYVAQVARGLAHAHQMNLIHRDIKPANCLLDKNETVKLLDMGLARLTDDEASLTLDNNENVLGTADYLAPEQALNSHKADARADIYSLGCTLYYLLTGHPPFPDGTISERLLKHQVEQAPSIFKDRPDAPSILVSICNKMMAKRADERYQTAGEAAESLATWLADHGVTVGGSGKRTQKPDSGGVGSDVFRRFGAALQKANEAKRASKSSQSGVRPPLPAGAVARTEPQEEIGLAPVEDDAPVKLQAPPRKEQKESDRSLADTVSKAASETPSAELTKPLRSLVEEELERAKAAAPAVRPQRKEGDFDPLRPPGFTPPSYGPQPWVFVVIGLGVVALIAVVVGVVMFS